jgi:NADH:ubiquinone oxidoreductase subunit 5 (subunit L)/multisubunit Na+/H+ antiporter MnhA subunit
VFEISVKNVTLMTIVVLALMMLISGLTFNTAFEEPAVFFNEDPIVKNKKLQIEHGEEYVYSYLMSGNQSINITYVVIKESNCTRIFIDESVNNTNICVDEWGVDETGSNATFKDPSFLLFKPWMLALHDSWKWNNSMYMNLGDMNSHIANNSLRVVRVEEYMNRTAYVVELSTSTGSKEYQWVDSEKRIMLKSLGEGYQVELVDN